MAIPRQIQTGEYLSLCTEFVAVVHPFPLSPDSVVLRYPEEVQEELLRFLLVDEFMTSIVQTVVVVIPGPDHGRLDRLQESAVAGAVSKGFPGLLHDFRSRWFEVTEKDSGVLVSRIAEPDPDFRIRGCHDLPDPCRIHLTVTGPLSQSGHHRG